MDEQSSSGPGTRQTPRRGRALLLGIALVVLAAVAYGNAINHPFLYDDIVLVLKNPAIRSLDNIPSFIGVDAGSTGLRTRWTRDVTHALEFAAVGAQPALYHLTNVVLHALVGVVLFALLAQLTGNLALGWWAAALFTVHPVNTEVVAHISGRRELLAALFGGLFLLFMAAYYRKGGVWRFCLALPVLYLAAFSKEMALMAAPAAVLIELYVRAREKGTTTSSESGLSGLFRAMLQAFRSRVWAHATLAAVTLFLAGLILFGTADHRGLAGLPSFYETSGEGLDTLDRMHIAGMGARLLALPVGLTVDYSFDALGINGPGLSAAGAVSLIFLIGSILMTVAGLIRRTWVGLGGLLFILFYLPVSGIIPWHEIFAERFLYMPGIGFCLAAASGMLWLSRQVRLRDYATAGGIVILMVLAFLTIDRNRDWGSAERLWASAAERYPGCARAHKALADEMLTEGRAEVAFDHYRRAVEILPTYKDAHIGVAASLAAQRRFQESLTAIAEVRERWPRDEKALNLQGYLYQSLGNDAKALAAYQEAVEINPSFAEGYNNLGRIFAELGDLEGAVRMYEQALSADPSMSTALINLATIHRHGFKDEETALQYEARARAVTQRN
jgi:tetratricopeptide (TPR) repeat protein